MSCFVFPCLAGSLFTASITHLHHEKYYCWYRYMGYRHDVKSSSGSAGVEELWLAFFALMQSLLLGSFAAILAAHRSEILDKPGSAVMDMMDEMHGINTKKQGSGRHHISDTYEPVTIPPSPTTAGVATSPSATLSTNGSSSIQHDMG
jgi:hypothetical protein